MPLGNMQLLDAGRSIPPSNMELPSDGLTNTPLSDTGFCPPPTHHAIPSSNTAVSTPRQPLGETQSRGNAQPPTVPALSSLSVCQLPLSAASLPQVPRPSLPTPSYPCPPSLPSSVLPLQGSAAAASAVAALGGGRVSGGMGGYDVPYGPGSLRYRRDATRLMRMGGPGPFSLRYCNPFYYAPQFQPYRHNQSSMENRDDQRWPDNLEDAFLDAILLMPHMGRKKFILKGQQNGRNMLILLYIQQQSGKLRKRKQVSSHMQVLKNFFTGHRCFHFFFPKDDNASTSNNNLSVAERFQTPEEQINFKRNPVLKAFAADRLPDVKPNYQYFGQLLQSDNSVAIKLKTASVYVMHDGIGLDPDMFPHLADNIRTEREYDAHLGPRSASAHRGKVIVYEYAKSVEQVTSVSTRNLAARLENQFSNVSEKFTEITEQEETKNKASPMYHCDIVHCRTVIELPNPNARFPERCELAGMVEVTIARPDLQSHAWTCITHLDRPTELAHDGQTSIKEVTEVGTQFTHLPGCEGAMDGITGAHCDCPTARRSQDIRLPFLVNEWVHMLMQASKYSTVDALEENDGDSAARRGATEGREADGPRAVVDRESEAARLLRKVCMLQELYSRDPSAPPGSSGQGWTRRAVVVWTFENHIHLGEEKKDKPLARVTETPGTTWRFMTLLDPKGEYHQQRVYISPTQAAENARAAGILPSSSMSSPAISSLMVERNSLLSPDPGYSAVASENYGTGWDSAASTPLVLNSLSSITQHYPPPDQSSLPSSSHGTSASGFSLDFGLAMPPPSASALSHIPTFDPSVSNLATLAPATGQSIPSSYDLSHQHDLNNMSFMSNSTLATSAGESFSSTVISNDGLDDKAPAPEFDPALTWDGPTAAAPADPIAGLGTSWYDQPTQVSPTHPSQDHSVHVPTSNDVAGGNYFSSQQGSRGRVDDSSKDPHSHLWDGIIKPENNTTSTTSSTTPENHSTSTAHPASHHSYSEHPQQHQQPHQSQPPHQDQGQQPQQQHRHQHHPQHGQEERPDSSHPPQSHWVPPPAATAPEPARDYASSGWTPPKKDAGSDQPWLNITPSSPATKLDFSLSPLKAVVAEGAGQTSAPPPTGGWGGSACWGGGWG